MYRGRKIVTLKLSLVNSGATSFESVMKIFTVATDGENRDGEPKSWTATLKLNFGVVSWSNFAAVQRAP